MSRGDFGSGYQSSYGSNIGDTGGLSPRNNDSDYIRLSDSVRNNIGLVARKIENIRRMVNQIGTPQDNAQLFERLQNEQKESNRIAKETSESLKTLSHMHTTNPTEARQRKIAQEKFQEEFSNVLQNLQKVHRLAAEKERASVQRARAKSMERGFTQYESQETGSTQPGPQIRIQQEADLSLDMIREREEALRKLESDIVDVNEIFKDLAILVHEQGEIIDSIEANVEGAQVNVETANVQLEKARHYQKASRKKMCCLLVILLLAALILGLIIYFSVKK